jgi:hypothetical protein
MSEGSLGNFKYYLGMEYEEEFIISQIVNSGYVIVQYDSDCERLEDIIEHLIKLEE